MNASLSRFPVDHSSRTIFRRQDQYQQAVQEPLPVLCIREPERPMILPERQQLRGHLSHRVLRRTQLADSILRHHYDIRDDQIEFLP